MRGRRTVGALERAGRVSVVLLVLIGVCAGTCPSALADDADPTRFQASRIVVVGDVHGAYDALIEVLRETSIIDGANRWAGGTAHLVSLGDLLDRGPHSRRVMDLLMALQGEARAAGGRVHVVLGNHELMNLTGDLRYVSAAEFAAFADEPADPEGAHPPGFLGLNRAFAADGTYGSWLLEQPVAVVINDVAFVHGGLPETVVDLPPAELNAASRSKLVELLSLRARLQADGVIEPWQDVQDSAQALAGRLADGEWSGQGDERADTVGRFIELAGHPLFWVQGVQWYRGTAACHHLLERPVLEAVLKAWDVQRVVMGHTPTPDRRIRMRLGGLAVLADTGMLAEYYNGRASALLIEDLTWRSVYPGTNEAPAEPRLWHGMELDGRPAEDVRASLDSATLNVPDEAATAYPDAVELGPADSFVLQFGASPTSGGLPPGRALFVPGSRAEVARNLAAYRLDRLLDLHLVPPTVERVVDGKTGVVAALWERSLTEAARQAQNVQRADWCAGRSDYQLMYVFDALVGNSARTPRTMLYDRRTWQLGLIDHANAFGRGRDLPAYLSRVPQTIPPALAEALQTLNAAVLEAELGDLLSGPQRRAILARRDRLLSTWSVGD
jgi:hypothetical protein